MLNQQNDSEDELNTKIKKERKKYQEEIESNTKKYQEEIESLQEDNLKALNKLTRQMQMENDKFQQEKQKLDDIISNHKAHIEKNCKDIEMHNKRKQGNDVDIGGYKDTIHKNEVLEKKLRDLIK